MKKYILIGINCLIISASLFYFLLVQPLTLEVRAMNLGTENEIFQLFWADKATDFSENRSERHEFVPNENLIRFKIPQNSSFVRIDPIQESGKLILKGVTLRHFIPLLSYTWSAENNFMNLELKNGLLNKRVLPEGMEISAGHDLQIELDDFSARADKIKIRAFYLVAFLCFLITALNLIAFSPARTLEARSGQKWIYVYPIYIASILFITGILAYHIWSDRSRSIPSSSVDAFRMSLVDHQGNYLSDSAINQDQSHEAALKVVFDPFAIYRFYPNQAIPGVPINEFGLRGQFNLQDPRPKIFVLGGSASFSLGINDDSKTLPSQLGQMHPQAQIINAGVIGYLSGQEFSLMSHYLDDFHPAAYITFTGWNDFSGQIYPRAGSHLGFNQHIFYEIERLLRKACKTCKDGSTTEDQNSVEDKKEIKRLARGFVNYLIKMKYFAEARGAKFHAVIQPEAGSKKHLTDAEATKVKRFFETIKIRQDIFSKSYQDFSREAVRLAKAEGFEIYNMNADPEFQNSSEDLFEDQVHLSEKGATKAANLISQKIHF